MLDRYFLMQSSKIDYLPELSHVFGGNYEHHPFVDAERLSFLQSQIFDGQELNWKVIVF